MALSFDAIMLLVHHDRNGRSVKESYASAKNKTGESFTLKEGEKALAKVKASGKPAHIAANEIVTGELFKVVRKAKKVKKTIKKISKRLR